MAVLVTIEAVAIALLALLVVGLLRSHGEILRALHDLGISLDGDHPATDRSHLPSSRAEGATTSAGDVSGVDPHGNAIAVAVGGRDRTLLAFLSSGCLTCSEFWEAFRRPAALDLPPGVRVVVVTKGPDQETPARVAELAPADTPVIMSTDAWLDYEIQVAPYFVLVDGVEGRIVGEGAGATWGQVRSLLGQALDDSGPGPRRWRPSTDAEREAEVDRALLAAGVTPGDPRLYHEPDGRGGR
jgi:hypothetical protein